MGIELKLRLRYQITNVLASVVDGYEVYVFEATTFSGCVNIKDKCVVFMPQD